MQTKTKFIISILFLLSGFSLASSAQAATIIYRSVGPLADDALATGTGNNLIISGSTATFASAPGNNIGVGDAIQYDSDGDNSVDAIAFIHGRTSGVEYTVKTAAGAAPTEVIDDQNWSIFRAYTSLFNAELGDENDSLDVAIQEFETHSGGKNLTDVAGSNEQWNFVCYAGQGGVADGFGVGIGGWTTDSDNYIKIYTPYLSSEVGTSQRHNGKWDDTKYRLVVPSDDAIAIGEGYVRVDGIQAEVGDGEFGRDGIAFVTGVVGEGYASNCILKGGGAGNANMGIRIESVSASTIYVWNCIAYGFTGTSSSGYYCTDADATVYSYNSVAYGDNRGFARVSGSMAVFNSASFGNTDDFSGTISADYCASDDGDGTNAVTPADWSTVFVDYANYDFHLKSTDTDLKNAGVSDPGSGLFSTDIDGEPRPSPAGGAWDIGADERPTDNVYYSVGQSTADLSNNGSSQTCTVGGDCTITISGGTATFNFAQTGNIGVGDRVTYNTSSIAYISGKVSATQWTVVTATGGAPANVTGQALNSITREYTTLSAAEAGATDSNHLNTANLVTGNYVLNLPCYYDTGADTTAVTINGYTTGASNYIKIYTPNSTTTEANTSQRHSGKWSAGKYRLETSNAVGSILVSDEFTTIDGLQIMPSRTDTTNGSGIHLYSLSSSDNRIKITNNIIRQGSGGGTGSLRGIHSYNSYAKFDAWNNIVYDFRQGIGDGLSLNVGNSAYFFNNTAIDCDVGLRANEGTVIAKNNIVKGSGDTNAYVGTFATGTDYNATDGTDAIGQGSNNRVSQIFTFTDEANDDFHLSSADTGATKHGANLSNDTNLEFAVDIDGETRVGTWDIGADEASLSIAEVNNPDLPPPANKMTINMSLTDKMTDGLVGMWSFDGPDVNMSTNTAYDRSPVGTNHGTISGATPVIGKKGQGMGFDGSSNQVSIGDLSAVEGQSALTVSAWVKNNKTALNTGEVIIEKEGSGTDTFELYWNTGEDIVFRVATSGGSASGIYTDGIPDGSGTTWHHVVGVYDGSNVMVYVDGVNGATNPGLTGTTSNSALSLSIGGDGWWANNWDGAIDEVRIYDRAFSINEISDLYRMGQAYIKN